MNVKKSDVLKKLKECYDPEMPINIVDLGLVYDVKVDKGNVYIKMTLTSFSCPLAGLIIEEAKNKVKEIKGVKDVNIEIVWDPPWSPERMSKKARDMLGI